MVRAAAFSLVFLFLGLASTQAQDTKAQADSLISTLCAAQNADWTFGTGLTDTAIVLDLLTRSPRHYNELDGPFFRRAAERVAESRAAELSDGWRVLALAGAVTPQLIAVRDAALERLREQAPLPLDLPSLLALRTFDDGTVDRARATAVDQPVAIAVLLASDAASIPAPPAETGADWFAWARAARLRGLRPTEPFPALTTPTHEPGRETPSLSALVVALEQVIAIHGLPRLPSAAPEAPVATAAKVQRPRELVEALETALGWLQQHQQGGTFGLGLPGWEGPEPGITALCLSSALKASQMVGSERPAWIDPGLDFLVGLQRPDGSIHAYGLAVYTTSVAMEALLDGGRDADRAVVERARQFLVEVQSDEGEGYSNGVDPHYGGIGYGNDERPDLSNTQFALEAVHRADPAADPEFYAKALEFLKLLQNAGEIETHSWPRSGGGTLVSGTDGGATYMPGNSEFGEVEIADGVYTAVSYGSMTYALTKSYLICGLDAHNERVKAAVNWLVAHYTFDTNPGFSDPRQAHDGLYYYYMAMSRTLRMVPDDLLVRADDSPIDWRLDLRAKLLAEQRIDGSWINDASPRWFERAPPLCTAYALLALAAAEG